MVLRSRPIFSLLLLFLSSYGFSTAFASGSAIEGGEEDFSEELLLKPLPDRKVLAHFHFETRAPRTPSYGRHHHLFPKAIAQLVKKFHIQEMELSFTQGRWNYESWGGFEPIASSNAKPPGVELWAVFDVPPDDVDASWKNLTHSISGLFCASINFLESSTAYAAPKWSFRPDPGSLRYGTLPREAVCTENLTPWLKLLPCRDKAGISLLMDRPSIYRGFYHSQRLRLRSAKTSSDGTHSSIILEQTLTVVLHPDSQKMSTVNSREPTLQPSWSMSSLFGKKISGTCVLAKSSTVYLQLDWGVVRELKNLENGNQVLGVASIMEESFVSNPAFVLSDKPDKVIREVDSRSEESAILYEFSVRKHSDLGPFDLGFTWKTPVVWSCPQLPLRVSRFLMGSGNERGAIAISFRSARAREGLTHAKSMGESCKVDVNVFQVVPWYIKVYFHTMKVFVDGKPLAVSDIIEKIHVSPSEDKVSPGVLEMILKLPCTVDSAAFTLEFDKGFLHIDEYPPDANQGFDIPPAVITFPTFHVNMHFGEDNLSKKSAVLSRFQENIPVRSYTEVLLVPLTTPDFSMPYNVITITCTVFALYFGSLLNVLRRRVNEEERFLKSKGKRPSALSRLLSKLSAKLGGKRVVASQSSARSSSFISLKLILKIILVAGIAIAWQYFSE
ncbi:GPI transamidase component PIG-T [Rhodamnia argentea]|uniref:GPI transamidase component PIG-T n=1 Tax=Rhodamnia argentea TaxID=178133 RepID=A0A8B8QBK3_9MYRT|nr:GPI transamidase component PIG-T [Rhodamnia argentea]